MGRLVVVGSLNVDSVIAVQRHPAPGETVLGGDAQTFWGGKGANQAVAAARAARASVGVGSSADAGLSDGAGAAGANGSSRASDVPNAASVPGSAAGVVFVGRVGADAPGRAYRERLAELGVDVAPLVETPGVPTGSAVIAVSAAGENTIIVSSGANARLGVDDLGALEQLTPDDVVVITLEVPLDVVTRASELAEQAGARFVLNLSPVVDLPAEVVRRAEPVVVNEHEAVELAARYDGLTSVLVTRGSDGSEWNGVFVPSASGIDVVDTTGAGDAYCGTLAYALARGDGAEAAMRAATAAAADVVGRAGAQ
jgi:ribokinase